MKQNLVALSVNVARAYEIAKSGNHSISLIPSKDDDCQKMIDSNCATLREFYGMGESLNSDIVIELRKIGVEDILLSYSERLTETLEDILVRITESQKSKEIPKFELNNVNKSLFKSAIDRLNLSIRQVNSIISVSQTIAKLSKSKDVKIEHLAEAIQYQSIQID